MASSLRGIVLVAALLYGATAEAAEGCKPGEQCVHDDIEESALLQTKVEPLGAGNSPDAEGVGNSPLGAGNSPGDAKFNKLPVKVDNTQKSEPMLVDLLAKFDDLQAKVNMVKGAVLTQNTTTDPDDEYDNDARELLSTRATLKSTEESCPTQPDGWNGCAWGRVWSFPAYCGSSNRITLNEGTPLPYTGCAFLTAQSSGCSNYFYTTSTSDSAGGVCKCCKQAPGNGGYYKSKSCNYVYYADPSCNLR